MDTYEDEHLVSVNNYEDEYLADDKAGDEAWVRPMTQPFTKGRVIVSVIAYEDVYLADGNAGGEGPAARELTSKLPVRDGPRLAFGGKCLCPDRPQGIVRI